jgi:uncharacterized glyoxalase superfamily protein PhnB
MAKKKIGKSSTKAARKPVKKAAKKVAAKTVKKATVKKRPAKKAAPVPKPLPDGRAPGYPQMTPSLCVRDAEAAIRFYETAFGFKLVLSMPGPGGSGISHAQLSFHGGRIMISPEGAMGGTAKAPASSGQAQPGSLYVYCPDVDAFTDHARAHGAKILMEPVDQFWGDRMVYLEDLDGYHWAFATHVGAFDASKAPSGDH